MKIRSVSEPKHAGGRPRKFAEPSRPITITLPERTLALLRRIGPDRARAIATSVDAVLGASKDGSGSVQLVEVSPGAALILVGPSAQLRRIPWLRLAEVAPARNVLWMPTGTSVDRLEVAVTDLLEDVPASEKGERELLTRLHQILRRGRRDLRITKGEILLVDTTGAK
jgi:hypothetical protein